MLVLRPTTGPSVVGCGGGGSAEKVEAKDHLKHTPLYQNLDRHYMTKAENIWTKAEKCFIKPKTGRN